MSDPAASVSPADTIRWHTQTLAGGSDVPPDERGDCTRACITSILGLPITAVANAHGEGWWHILRGEVHRHGYDLAIIDTRWEPPLDAYWIATVPSLNLGLAPDGNPSEHCVVARGYTLIHDPALGERYDDEKWAAAWNADKVTEGRVLVPLDPAVLLSGRERDKAEIADLRERLNYILTSIPCEWDQDVLVWLSGGEALTDVRERDRRQIERLTAALKGPRKPRVHQGVAGYDVFVEGDFLIDVLADKEDTDHG